MNSLQKTSLVLILLSSLFINGCDCIQEVSGCVINKKTKSRISGVNVMNVTKESCSTITDSTGCFELHSISGGLFRCPPMKIKVEVNGYKTKEVKIRNLKSKLIKLKPLKK